MSRVTLRKIFSCYFYCLDPLPPLRGGGGREKVDKETKADLHGIQPALDSCAARMSSEGMGSAEASRGKCPGGVTPGEGPELVGSSATSASPTPTAPGG